MAEITTKSQYWSQWKHGFDALYSCSFALSIALAPSQIVILILEDTEISGPIKWTLIALAIGYIFFLSPLIFIKTLKWLKREIKTHY